MERGEVEDAEVRVYNGERKSMNEAGQELMGGTSRNNFPRL